MRRRRPRASCCLTAPTWSGTSTCRTSCPGRCTAIASHGPYEPDEGHRFNPNKVLLDPYAKAIARETKWADEMWGYKVGDPTGRPVVRRSRQRGLCPPGGWSSTRPSPGATIGRRKPPGTKRSSTSCTSRDSRSCIPTCPRSCAARYAGLASEAAIRYLKDLGITAVELLPVHEHVDDRHLVEHGLVNYWGYNTLGFFAPEPAMRGLREAARRRARIQDDGPQPALGRHRGDSRRGLQPHGRRQPDRAHALASAASTMPRIIGCRRKTRATTWTSPAAATRSTCAIRACCN